MVEYMKPLEQMIFALKDLREYTKQMRNHRPFQIAKLVAEQRTLSTFSCQRGMRLQPKRCDNVEVWYP